MTVLFILAGAFVLYLAWALCTSAARGDELVVVALEKQRRDAMTRAAQRGHMSRSQIIEVIRERRRAER